MRSSGSTYALDFLSSRICAESDCSVGGRKVRCQVVSAWQRIFQVFDRAGKFLVSKRRRADGRAAGRPYVKPSRPTLGPTQLSLGDLLIYVNVRLRSVHTHHVRRA
jgi:hypothetical protein